MSSSASRQTSSIYPGEALCVDAAPVLASYLRTHSSRDASLLVLSGGAPDGYCLAQRRPASPYLWPPNLDDVPRDREHSPPRSDVLVLQADQLPASQGPAGYRRVTQIGPYVLFERLSAAEGPNAIRTDG